MLEVGQKAPEFSLPDQNGVIHKLSDYLGKKLFCTFIQRIIHRGVQNRPVVILKDILTLQKKMQ